MQNDVVPNIFSGNNTNILHMACVVKEISQFNGIDRNIIDVGLSSAIEV